MILYTQLKCILKVNYMYYIPDLKKDTNKEKVSVLKNTEYREIM